MANLIKFDSNHMIIKVNKFNRACITITVEYLRKNLNVECIGGLSKEEKNAFFALIPNSESYDNLSISCVDAEYLKYSLEDETQIM